jgi:Kef-type K+ transport system membrane component KefB|tara:strand:+ start:370 stop:516 length:147 start_codon:yes stop_codon:yes gene_type:complete
VGISIKLLSDAKMLNSLAGQTTLTAAFIDDVFSLVLLVLLASLSEGQA